MTEQTGNNKPNEAEGLAFPLSGNEKLIESVRDWPTITRMSHSTQLEKLVELRDALEAAGKALTPTEARRISPGFDTTREAYEWLTPTVIERHDLVMPIYEDEATPTDDPTPAASPHDLIGRLASALRRSEVPEPSAEGPAFIALMPPSPETSKRWYSMYCRVCGIEEMMAGTADDPRLLARRDEHNRERHAEPQGEPSDAEAWAAAHAFAAALKEQTGRPQMVNVEHARAALRAAGVVGQEGESRG